MGIMRNAIEGWEPPLLSNILIDDINWWIVKADYRLRKAIEARRFICLPGEYIISYHDEVTHRLIDQIVGKQNEI